MAQRRVERRQRGASKRCPCHSRFPRPDDLELLPGERLAGEDRGHRSQGRRSEVLYESVTFVCENIQRVKPVARTGGRGLIETVSRFAFAGGGRCLGGSLRWDGAGVSRPRHAQDSAMPSRGSQRNRRNETTSPRRPQTATAATADGANASPPTKLARIRSRK
jgi:hypothetical protein